MGIAHHNEITTQPTPRKLFGRRIGKSLHTSQRAVMDNLLPHLTIALPPTMGTLNPAILFDEKKTNYWCEIGFGTGDVLSGYARQNPAIGFLGAEPFINGQSALLKSIAAHNIKNIRIYPDDGLALLQSLQPACLDKLFVMFADPWPKRRHASRRFIQQNTLHEIARVLKPGGELRLASDDPTLITWLVQQTVPHPMFVWPATGPADWLRRPQDQPQSRYEEKALDAGRTPHYFSFIRTA